MAIRTVDPWISLCVDAVRWGYTWDDSQLRLRSLICTNNSSQPSTLRVRSNSTGAEVSFTCQPGATLNQNIPPGQAAQFGVTIDARGRVDGISYFADGGC